MIPDNVRSMMQTLLDDGYEAYIIGGAVRDSMMGVPPSDWDIFTDANGDEIISLFPHGKIIGNNERQTKILTVVVNGVEVSQYRSNGNRTEVGTSLEQHLATCDFTMNALTLDIDEVVGGAQTGMDDIVRKKICCVGDPKDRIEEDKLRVFRAIRFALKYDMKTDVGLLYTIKTTDVSDIPIERVREEILKIFAYRNGLNLLSQDLLSQIIPEFDGSYSLNGGKHHDETVDDHMMNAQNIACSLTDNPILIFACAFHDIGKPYTRKDKPDGGISFHNHEKIGAKMLRVIMDRMKFSNDNIKFVEAIVSEHMFGYDDDTNNKTFVKHFQLLEDAGVSIGDYMMMRYSDDQANTKNVRIKFGDYVSQSDVFTKYYEMKFSKMPFRISDLVISGRDLIDIGIPVGIEIGNMLREIFDMVVDGKLDNERHVLMKYIKTQEIQ